MLLSGRPESSGCDPSRISLARKLVTDTCNTLAEFPHVPSRRLRGHRLRTHHLKQRRHIRLPLHLGRGHETALEIVPELLQRALSDEHGGAEFLLADSTREQVFTPSPMTVYFSCSCVPMLPTITSSV